MLYDAKWWNNVQENQMNTNKEKLRVMEAQTFSSNNMYCLLVLRSIHDGAQVSKYCVTVFSKQKCRNTSPIIVDEAWDSKLKDGILLFSLELQIKLQLKVLAEQLLQLKLSELSEN